MRCVLLFKGRKKHYICSEAAKVAADDRDDKLKEDTGMTMEDRDRLVQENQKLKEENELLLKTVEQLNGTVNRLISRYIVDEQ